MRILKAVAAGIAGLAIILVPPYLLVRYIGNPYPPEGIDLAAPLTDHAILGLLAVLVWVLWTQLTLSLLIELYAAVLDRPVDIRLPVFGFQQDLARVLVGAVIAATVATPIGVALFTSSAAASPDNSNTGSDTASGTRFGLDTAVSNRAAGTTSAEAPHRQATRHTQPTGRDQARLASEGTVAAGSRDSAPGGRFSAATPTVRHGSPAMPSATAGPGRIVTVTVSRGDTLWSLAETHLGDGARWTEIAAANDGHTMTDGTPFRSADQIRPGWRLEVPGLTDAPDSGGSLSVDHYEVKAGDTLSEVARDMLGDPLAYPAIFTASQELAQPGGDTLTDPDHIEPGWTLAVPNCHVQPGGQSGEAATPAQPPGDQQPSSRPTPHTSTDQMPSERPRGADDTVHSANQHRLPDTQTTPIPDADGVAGRRLEVVPDVSEGEAAVTVPRALLASALCLSAGALGALAVNRRRQFRCRRIGRTIAATPDALREVEQAIIETGAQAQPDVEFLDRALRHVAASCRVTGDPLPQLGAAVLGDEDLTLLFTRPAAGAQPEGWTATDDARAWMLSRDVFLEEDLEAQPAPYPALVSIGLDERGRTWLLDLETVGMYGIGGAPDQVADVARFLVAELALNVWSEGSEVLLGDGLGAELVGLNPRRVRPMQPQDAMARASAMAGEMDEVEENLRADLLTRRRDAMLMDSTYPIVMVVASRPEEDDLVADIEKRDRGRVVIVHRDQERPVVELSRDGTAFLPSWGISVRAFTLSPAEAEAMAALMASTRNLQDEPVPASASDDGPLGKYALADGSLREEYTQPRRTEGNDRSSMLPDADQVYLESAATTVEDLEAAGPSVPDLVRAEIAVLDPTLDGDVADWFDESSPRPKVHLLGPVEVTSLNGGDPQAIDNAGGTVSFIAYLAVQDHGVSGERAAAACGWKTQRTVQNRATNARFLLGTQLDGRDWLPDASVSTGARRGTTPTYELVRGVDGVLNSADLFVRLKHRAQRRGDDGCEHDLMTALSLVTGAPFEAATEHRFKWLFQPGQLRHDEILVGAIHDAAHILATRGLATGRTDLVTLACDTARKASPHSDIAWLDQAAATETQTGPSAAAEVIREHVLDRFDEDLPSRSEAVLQQREWDATG